MSMHYLSDESVDPIEMEDVYAINLDALLEREDYMVGMSR